MIERELQRRRAAKRMTDEMKRRHVKRVGKVAQIVSEQLDSTPILRAITLAAATHIKRKDAKFLRQAFHQWTPPSPRSKVAVNQNYVLLAVACDLIMKF